MKLIKNRFLKNGILFTIIFILIFFSFIVYNKKINLRDETYTSSHFLFQYKRKDTKCIKTLVPIFETNLTKITRFLNFTNLTYKIVVHISPSISDFHNYIGQPDAPDWLVGTIRNYKICLVSPLNPGPQHSYKSMQKVAVHELTHRIISEINPYLPLWLNEGLAVYEAQQKPDKKIFQNKNLRVPTLDQLNANFDSNEGYQFSYTLIDFIIKKYGRKKLRLLIDNPEDFNKIFKMKRDEFCNEWKIFLFNMNRQ